MSAFSMTGQASAGPPAPSRGSTKALVRRVTRVRFRLEDRERDVDEVFDDVILLWRAMESTIPREVGTSTDARSALAQTIEALRKHGTLTRQCPQIVAWVKALSGFASLSSQTIAQWFDIHPYEPAAVRDCGKRLESLRSAIEAEAFKPSAWHPRDSESLAWAMYKMRCAVVHPSLETNDARVAQVLPLFRQALIELAMARYAMLENKSMNASATHFDAVLARYAEGYDAE